ncbi:ROK family protein [Bifidobacterium sp. ESL0690]|uniref:ROK family protein n=1 Tax=Bifidobacterium sp. ESL0690 TaxID=2983214 RepID=UPI0023F68020|nr:ROK family protein [Bifidobacterium sp. ESL0690]WEV46209.1 ROK family protein [Bifidobacterium sp. ESL0690]
METSSPATSLTLHTPGKNMKASPTDVRRNNRLLIFGLLFPSHQYSRAELGRKTGLSRVAVSDVVKDMLNEGILCETGQETHNTGKGKRGTLLGIDTTQLHIISIDLSQAHLVRGAVTNLLGAPLIHSETVLGAEEKVQIETVIELIEELSKRTNNIIGIGISTTGVVQDGVIRRSTELGWENLDLKTPLEHRFSMPVFLTNDAAASVLTERYFGQAGPNVLFVKIDRGIGSATLLNDTVIVGENHAGGEIGHISINPNGPLCRCGKRGCLEMTLSAPALREQLRGKDAEEQTQIISHAGQQLASALSMPIGLLDVEDVCIYGPPDIVNSTFCGAAQHYADLTTASSFRKHTTIRRCQCGPDISLTGAAIIVAQNYVSN